jgi:hypothetical protein
MQTLLHQITASSMMICISIVRWTSINWMCKGMLVHSLCHGPGSYLRVQSFPLRRAISHLPSRHASCHCSCATEGCKPKSTTRQGCTIVLCLCLHVRQQRSTTATEPFLFIHISVKIFPRAMTLARLTLWPLLTENSTDALGNHKKKFRSMPQSIS